MILSESLIFEGLKCESISQDKDSEVISFSVQAKTGAKVSKICKSDSGDLIVYTRQRPVDGKANKDIQESLSNVFGVSKSCIEIDKGEKSKSKKIVVYFQFTKDKAMSYYLEMIRTSILGFKN